MRKIGWLRDSNVPGLAPPAMPASQPAKPYSHYTQPHTQQQPHLAQSPPTHVSHYSQQQLIFSQQQYQPAEQQQQTYHKFNPAHPKKVQSPYGQYEYGTPGQIPASGPQFSKIYKFSA